MDLYQEKEKKRETIWACAGHLQYPSMPTKKYCGCDYSADKALMSAKHSSVKGFKFKRKSYLRPFFLKSFTEHCMRLTNVICFCELNEGLFHFSPLQ